MHWMLKNEVDYKGLARLQITRHGANQHSINQTATETWRKCRVNKLVFPMAPMGSQVLIDHSLAVEIRPLSLYEYSAEYIM